eukprot:1356566-Amorphochlora_amoeboformis.AAC.1
MDIDHWISKIQRSAKKFFSTWPEKLRLVVQWDPCCGDMPPKKHRRAPRDAHGSLGVDLKGAHNRSPSMMASIKWQFKKKGEWKNFLPEANDIIDKAKAEGKAKVKFNAFGNKYVLDFKENKVRIEGYKQRCYHNVRSDSSIA